MTDFAETHMARFYPDLLEEQDHTPEENFDLSIYEVSNFQKSSGEEAERSSEAEITSFQTYSASDYQEDLDGQTLVDKAETRIIWK